MLIHETSLSETVDAVHAAVLAWQNGGTKPSATERKETARWIAGRQGLPGAYAGSFAGFEHERQRGIQLFTGERITSASARHILGEETCRALRALNVRDRALQSALDRADGGLLEALGRAESDPRNTTGCRTADRPRTLDLLRPRHVEDGAFRDACVPVSTELADHTQLLQARMTVVVQDRLVQMDPQDLSDDEVPRHRAGAWRDDLEEPHLHRRWRFESARRDH